MNLYAAVDCGTNSTRLLIGDGQSERVVEELRFTRLGEGVHESRHISEPALQRTLDALGEYQRIIAAHGVFAVRAVATSAVRDASNKHDVLRRASEALGRRVEVIEGAEEARLGYAGAVLGRERSQPVMVVDVGGGSTELCLGRGSQLDEAMSIDVGSVRITESCLGGDPPSKEQLASARSWAQEMVRSSGIVDRARADQPLLLGTAAPPTTLASMDLGLRSWSFERVHGHELSLGRIEELLTYMTSLPAGELAAATGMHPGRATVITGGVLVLSEVMRAVGKESLVVSATDILDGLICTISGHDPSFY